MRLDILDEVEVDNGLNPVRRYTVPQLDGLSHVCGDNVCSGYLLRARGDLLRILVVLSGEETLEFEFVLVICGWLVAVATTRAQ